MKRLLVLALAVIMLLSTLVACGPADTDDGNGDSSNAQASGNNAATNPDGSSKDPSNPNDSGETDAKIGNLDPSINLKEKEITIISRDHDWMKDEVSVKNENADPINDSIFKRNQNVEKLLNVKIKNTLISGATYADYVVIDEIAKNNGPDCPYHLAANSAYTSFENTANGYFKNLKDIAHLDLSQDYWAPYFNPEASIGNQQYFATGAISLSLRRFIFVTFFNKDLANYYNLENLYDVVEDGRWTLDYQANIISNMWSEQDGMDGKTEGDSYGFITDDGIFVDAYIAACDVQILVKDSDDFYVLSPDTLKADDMMKKINQLYWKSGSTYVFGRQADYSQFDKIRTKFASGEATMITDRLIAVESEQLKNMDSEYGIIPIPKLNEEQKEYYSLAHDLFTVYGIVNSSVTDNMTDDLGAVLEAMAIESKRVVTPAYYEVALKGKYAKDQESWEMLDMIVNNLKINGGLIYTIKIKDLTQQFRDAVKAKKADTSTIFHPIKLPALKNALEAMQNEIKQ